MLPRTCYLAAFLGLLLAVAAGCSRGTDAEDATNPSEEPSEMAPMLGGNQLPSLDKADTQAKDPEVVIETSLGDITVRLDAEKAPLTVQNFLDYVRDGFYDRTIIHQVHRGQSIVAGGFGENLVEKPTRRPIRNEAWEDARNLRGTIAMVRRPDAIDSAASQFFINVADNPSLDYKDRTPAGYGYCVFGTVTEGMDVVDQINRVSVRNDPDLGRTPVEPILIKTIRRIQ